MALPLKQPLPPMEARSVDEPPSGDDWQYEPKWDGFRCIVFRDGDSVVLQSKSGKPLTRYFPEVVENVRAIPARRFVLDAEIVVPLAGRLSFDELLLRIHPAASRIRTLSAEYPAMLIVFDLLVDEQGKSLVKAPLSDRRARLEQFTGEYLDPNGAIRLSPATTSLNAAMKWFNAPGASLDGIIAKRLDMPYRSGERDAMIKIKHRRTADCVVGGFRYATAGKVVGSLLLGLYDDDGLLHHVGFTSGIKAADRAAITKKVVPLIKPPGFTGRAPGGPSRWSTERSTQWEPLDPRLVVEVEYDHFTGGRFRHGTRLLRWRPDKAPAQCTLDQVEHHKGPPIAILKRPRAVK